MNNILELHSDNTNIYVTIHVKTSMFGKFFLCGIFIFLISIFIFALANRDSSSISNFEILAIFSLLYIFPIKYLLWNLFGKEHLIINTKSISHSFDYGFIKTNLRTQLVNKLETYYQQRMSDETNEFGQLVFYNYRQDNNLPELLYTTNALLKKSEIEFIEAEIMKLYYYDFKENSIFEGFSEN